MATYDPIEIIKLFVFGTNDPSPDDYNLHIRPAVADQNQKGVPIHYDMSTYMTVGGGRYANPALFSVVNEFFTKDIIVPRSYTFEEILAVLGLSNDEGQATTTSISQYTTDVFFSGDFAERSYIFGNSEFEIKFSPETRFVIENNGARRIDGEIEVVALDDNFDFQSQPDSYSQLLNEILLEPTFDPYGLGRGEVPIIFDGRGKVYPVYGEADFLIDQENASVVNSVSLGAGIAALAVPGAFYFQNILSDTFLSYQQGGKKVIYGTPLDDILDKTDAELSISKFVLNSYLIAGGDGNDTITGWDYSDLLQGGIGNDILTGGKGFDLLEGGAGTDTYTINPGDGFDTILDTDGLGVIKFGTVDIKGKDNVTDDKDWIKIGDNWIDQENGFNYQLIDQGNDINDLLITLGASGDSAGVRIKNWQDGQLGITLGEGTPPDDPATNNTITGDLQPEDFDENADGVQIEYDELGNVIVTEEEALDRADTLFGSTDNDLIQSLGGNDTVDGKAGDDRIEGGSGQDQIDGGLGNDVLLGEAGSDIISGHENDDRLYAETEYTIAQAYNILNSRDHAIDYFYAPRLPGEAAEGVEDIHFHLIETRSIRCSTVAHF